MTHEDADNWNQTRKLQQKTECLAQESKQEGSEAITYLQLKIERPKQNAKKKKGEKLNFELCLTRLSFIKVTTSVTHASIYKLGSFLEKLSWDNFLEKLLWENFLEKL